MRSRGVAKMMFIYIRCVLQDRIGLNDISPYFLYLLLSAALSTNYKLKNKYKYGK